MKSLIALLLVAGSLLANTVSAEMVNINKASAEVIQENLKGIGAKKAAAIISYRTEHGDFKKLEDIKDVKGIGDALFEKIKADISLDQGLSTAGAAGAEGKVTAEKKPAEKTTKIEVKDTKVEKVATKTVADSAE